MNDAREREPGNDRDDYLDELQRQHVICSGCGSAGKAKSPDEATRTIYFCKECSSILRGQVGGI